MSAAVADVRKLTFLEKLSYGSGDFGYSLAYNMASAFLLYYYTNVVGLPAAAVGTIFLAARLLDAVIDILVGIAVDKTRSRWGARVPISCSLRYHIAWSSSWCSPCPTGR